MTQPHAGNQPVPAPAQAVANNFVTAVAPSLNDVTNSLIALIPSPPPPPPPPTVIQALAPLEEVRRHSFYHEVRAPAPEAKELLQLTDLCTKRDSSLQGRL